MDVLPACRKLADLLCNTFGDGPGKRDIIPAGEHIGLAPGSVLEPIVQFYRLTGEPSYLDFSKYLMRAFEQPNGPIIVSQLLELKRVDAVGDAKAVFAGASVLVMQLETPLETVQAAADLAVKAGVRVILNPAPAQPLPDKLLQSVSILTPNETEAELLTGIAVTDSASAAAAAAKLRARGVQTVIITLGARGAYVATESDERLVPGFNVKAMDTTAAGDVFNGALAVAIAEGKPLELAVRFANAAAAISVTRLGAQPSAPTRREIERFLKK
jgi:ribokinase